MIVPEYWAEGRIQHKEPGRQVTMRRFGWSDASQQDAQALADARAREALAAVLAGEKLARREPKMPYNGAKGVPIREEILARHGSTVVTRNAYGAHCLNTPDVLFVDVDFPGGASVRFGLAVFIVLVAGAIAAGVVTGSKSLGFAAVVAALLLGAFVVAGLHRLLLASQGGAQRLAWRRIRRFASRHPGWNLRVYRTPAGLRVLVTHRPFDPAEDDVAECFRALGADPVYVAMCRNQHCFRARVTAKPWRIGIAQHMRPRPGVWPVAPERRAVREAWIGRYEAVAASHAACRLVESLGTGTVHVDVAPVLELHDRLSRATSTLPLA